MVYFTRDLSAAGLLKIYDRVKKDLGGKVAIKLHTGEPQGPNIIPRPWVKELLQKRLPEGTIIETNTYYGGGRDTIEKHRQTLQVNGWSDFTTVDITDADGTCIYALPAESKHDLVERMESRHSMRQLNYMKEMGMGNDLYQLLDIDNGDKVITVAEAVKGIKGQWKPQVG